MKVTKNNLATTSVLREEHKRNINITVRRVQNLERHNRRIRLCEKQARRFVAQLKRLGFLRPGVQEMLRVQSHLEKAGYFQRGVQEIHMAAEELQRKRLLFQSSVPHLRDQAAAINEASDQIRELSTQLKREAARIRRRV